MAASASRRALTVLQLLRKAKAWHLDWAFFDSSSRSKLGGDPFVINRAINVNDEGIYAQIGLKPAASLPATRKRRWASAVWPVVRGAILGAGFEMRGDFVDEDSFGLFVRRLDSAADVRAEWRFLQALRLQAVARGAALPVRAGRSNEPDRCAEGAAHRAFEVLRGNRDLMSNLEMARIVRPVHEQIEGQPWKGRLALMGNSDWLQAIVQFWPDTESRVLSPQAREVLSCISVPLLDRGYVDCRDGAFVRSPLGPLGIQRELAFLDGLTLSALLTLGDSPRYAGSRQKQDREFYDLLGPERVEEPCKHPGCARGAVALSALCRVHHFEAIKKRACPFDD